MHCVDPKNAWQGKEGCKGDRMMKYGLRYSDKTMTKGGGTEMSNRDAISSLEKYITKIRVHRKCFCCYQRSDHPTSVLLLNLKQLLITMKHNPSASAEDIVKMWLEYIESHEDHNYWNVVLGIDKENVLMMLYQ
jgi:hypothetical protein